MENTKRTSKEVERDYRLIRIAAETTTAISLKDLALDLEITVSQLKTSLERHPRAKTRILKKINDNAAAYRQRRAEEAREKAEQEARRRAEKSCEKEKQEARKRAEEVSGTVEEVETNQKSAVLDASIVGFEGLLEYLEQKGVLIITSITIRELENLARFHDAHGIAARQLLAMAAENPDKVRTVLIAEECETPDDCIIQFAEDNKNDVVLLTSDKTMALKARMFGIETEYLKHGENAIRNKSRNTLLLASKEAGKMVIHSFITPFRSTLVLSDGIEYKIGPYELKVGDDVFVGTNKGDYITFSHYQMTALQEQDNCHLVYATRIYKIDKIEDLPKASYKSFMREFRHRLEENGKLAIN